MPNTHRGYGPKRSLGPAPLLLSILPRPQSKLPELQVACCGSTADPLPAPQSINSTTKIQALHRLLQRARELGESCQPTPFPSPGIENLGQGKCTLLPCS